MACNNTLLYKGYHGSAEVSVYDECLFGKIQGIDALVTYEGKDFSALKKAFEESVDSYLSLCKRNGINPEKEYSGQYKFRPGAELHKRLVQHAEKRKESLNSVTIQACENYLDKSGSKLINYHLGINYYPRFISSEGQEKTFSKIKISEREWDVITGGKR
jgi:predicted HicB family RNase H-like nuclease